ncbi:MAG TPA: four helix bundle protein [Longimicrobiales bacterium]|nr:four helix bundle protein [Longimicrobiales bacterium]
MRLERMRRVQAAEALVAEVDGLLSRAKARAPKPADHLERSADSVLFNMAEGVGAFKPKVKTGAYEVARKEANEVRAVLRRLVLKRVFTEPQVRKAYNLPGACVGMLTNAIIALENRPDP